MRSLDEYRNALSLVEQGLNDCEISRRTGIPVGTISGWRSGRGRVRRCAEGPQCAQCGCPAHDFGSFATPAYVYLLGLYLGDGCVGRYARTWGLVIALDATYPEIVRRCCKAMQHTLPSARVRTRRSAASRLVTVRSYSKQWPCLLPQHGPGRKHTRRIALVGWQQAATAQFPVALLRGLVHSDGCRCTNRVRTASRTYEYTRYFFRNASEDILGIFGDTCDCLGVPWTRSGPRTISISKRVAVRQLDSWIGPKR
jgi:hypothetical protein